MAERAQVTSVAAIESFRAALIVFLSKARPTLEEVSGDVLRTKLWVENDQRNHWDNQMRLARRELERAQAELFSAKLSNLQEATGVQEMVFHRAQRAIREVEAKQTLVKKWNRDLENRTDPLLRLVDQLHRYLTTDQVLAAAFLGEVVKSLEAYAGVTAPAPLTVSTKTGPDPKLEVAASNEQETSAVSPGPNEQTPKS